MTKLQEIKSSLQSRVNELRSLQRLISGSKFEESYENATELERKLLDEYLLKVERESITKWMKTVLRRNMELGDYPSTELRKIASELGIADYHILSKASLLSEIKRHHERHRTTD